MAGKFCPDCRKTAWDFEFVKFVFSAVPVAARKARVMLFLRRRGARIKKG
jgi:hypothetical protein